MSGGEKKPMKTWPISVEDVRPQPEGDDVAPNEPSAEQYIKGLDKWLEDEIKAVERADASPSPPVEAEGGCPRCGDPFTVCPCGWPSIPAPDSESPAAAPEASEAKENCAPAFFTDSWDNTPSPPAAAPTPSVEESELGEILDHHAFCDGFAAGEDGREGRFSEERVQLRTKINGLCSELEALREALRNAIKDETALQKDSRRAGDIEEAFVHQYTTGELKRILALASTEEER